jgi:hypothetical protein
MQDCHDHLEGTAAFLGVHVGRDAASVVLYADGVVRVDAYFYVPAVSGEGLVDGVVDHFVDEVVEALDTDIAYVHGRPFPDRLQTFQHLDAVCAVTVGLTCLFVDFHNVARVSPFTGD